MQVSQIEQKAQEKTAETRYQENGWSIRSPLAMLGIFVRGVAMGAADIVPGVSGGTMAFIFGIYEELINSIKTIGQRNFLDAVPSTRCARKRTSGWACRCRSARRPCPTRTRPAPPRWTT